MTTMIPQSLFVSQELRVFLQHQQQLAIDFVMSLTNAAVVTLSDDEWLKEALSKMDFAVPVLDKTNITRDDVEGNVPAMNTPNPRFASGGPHQRGTAYIFHIAYTGSQGYFYHRPTRIPLRPPVAVTSPTDVQITVAGAWMDSAAIEKDLHDKLAQIEDALASQRGEVLQFQASMPAVLMPRIKARRAEAEAAKAVSAGIKYPIRQRSGAPPPPPTPPAIRPKPKPPALPANPGADPVLEEAHYKNILQIIQNMSLAMERSPVAFAEMEEEHIRFHFVMQLNGQYEGEAVGEAFNLGGKTDILVRHQGQNLFVAECKFWDGQKSLKDTVDQLYRYVTWRDTKTAVIMFSDRESFTAVLDEAKKAMLEHPQYASGPTVEGDTRFRYRFSLPGDAQRHITLTLMLFNVRPPKK